MMTDVRSWRFLRRAARWSLSRNVDLTVEGLSGIPRRGPVLIAARHYHHLYDGCIVVAAIDRPTHIVVGLDWIANPLLRRLLYRLCGLARWPIVIRNDPRRPGALTAAQRRDRRTVLLKSARDTVGLLREGRVVLVFPEAFPNIDPGYTPKQGDAFLPFQEGLLSYARMAEVAKLGRIPIVPLGFAYTRPDADGKWRATARFGASVMRGRHTDADLLRLIETQVKALSRKDASGEP